MWLSVVLERNLQLFSLAYLVCTPHRQYGNIVLPRSNVESFNSVVLDEVVENKALLVAKGELLSESLLFISYSLKSGCFSASSSHITRLWIDEYSSKNIPF